MVKQILRKSVALATSIANERPGCLSVSCFGNNVSSILPCSCFLARSLLCWPSVSCLSGSFSPRRTPFCRLAFFPSVSSFDSIRGRGSRKRRSVTHAINHSRTPDFDARVRYLRVSRFRFSSFIASRSHGLSLNCEWEFTATTIRSIRCMYV